MSEILPTPEDLRNRLGLSTEEFNTEQGEAVLEEAVSMVCDECERSIPSSGEPVPSRLRTLVMRVARRGYIATLGLANSGIDDYREAIHDSMFIDGLTEDECRAAKKLSPLNGGPYSVPLRGGDCL